MRGIYTIPRSPLAVSESALPLAVIGVDEELSCVNLSPPDPATPELISSLAPGVTVPIPTSFDQSVYIGIDGLLMPVIADSSVMSPADHPVSHHD